jgi:hypothetical protein
MNSCFGRQPMGLPPSLPSPFHQGDIPLIQITRILAKQIRAIIKKTLHRQVTQPVLTFRSGDAGLFVEVQGTNQALQFHDPRPQDREILLVPLGVLDDVQGSKAEPVFLNTRRVGILGASWQEKGVFQDLEYDAPEPVAEAAPFPALPAQFVENTAELLVALREAYETTDVESKRYALASIQIRGGEGVIAATDGRQLLKQSGFTFGFADELLLEHSKFFASKELPQDRPMRVGKTDEQVVFQIGPWTYWLGVSAEGRFPDIDRSIPSTHYSKATLKLASADAKFLVDHLHRLPNGDRHRELTVDLNGKVILRAASLSTPRPAEMSLRNSSKQGEDVRVCTDRKFLARAAAMGFSEIHFPDTAAPAIAIDANRTFVWMLLDPKEALKPSEDCLRIESPFSTRNAPPVARRADSPLQQIAATDALPPPQPAPAAHSQPVTESASQLRTTLAAVNELIRAIKAEKRGRRSLKRTMEASKPLQKVA